MLHCVNVALFSHRGLSVGEAFGVIGHFQLDLAAMLTTYTTCDTWQQEPIVEVQLSGGFCSRWAFGGLSDAALM